MNYAYLLGLLALAPSAQSCELFATVGKTTPAAQTQPVGVAGVGCRLDNKVDVTLWWVAEADLFDGAHTDPAYALLTISHVWQFERKFLRGTPELQMGLGLKESETCDYNGHLNCNRRQPLPFSFHFGAGLEWRAVRLQLFHDSNNAMDEGEEAKNRGITWLTLTHRFN